MDRWQPAGDAAFFSGVNLSITNNPPRPALFRVEATLTPARLPAVHRAAGNDASGPVREVRRMIRKVLKIVAIVLALAFIGVQFIRPSFVNPPVVASETIVANANVPTEVREVLGRSCNDCHSNETEYPWYSYVTPFNWFLSTHIDEGRHEMNFSRWGTYTKEQKTNKLDEICEVVEGGSMPLPSYLWIHRDAALSEGDADLLCNWAKAEAVRVESGARPAQ